MVNITEDLRNKVVRMPVTGEFITDIGDCEVIDKITLTMKDCNKVKLKAEQAREKFLSEWDGSEDLANKFAAVEYNNSLKYWSTVYSLAIDDEPAYKVNGLKQVMDTVDNYFGTKYNPIYESFAKEVCEDNGLKLSKPVTEDDTVTD
jgi:hypothetical protein